MAKAGNSISLPWQLVFLLLITRKTVSGGASIVLLAAFFFARKTPTQTLGEGLFAAPFLGMETQHGFGAAGWVLLGTARTMPAGRLSRSAMSCGNAQSSPTAGRRASSPPLAVAIAIS